MRLDPSRQASSAGGRQIDSLAPATIGWCLKVATPPAPHRVFQARPEPWKRVKEKKVSQGLPGSVLKESFWTLLGLSSSDCQTLSPGAVGPGRLFRTCALKTPSPLETSEFVTESFVMNVLARLLRIPENQQQSAKKLPAIHELCHEPNWAKHMWVWNLPYPPTLQNFASQHEGYPPYSNGVKKQHWILEHKLFKMPLLGSPKVYARIFMLGIPSVLK